MKSLNYLIGNSEISEGIGETMWMKITNVMGYEKVVLKLLILYPYYYTAAYLIRSSRFATEIVGSQKWDYFS